MIKYSRLISIFDSNSLNCEKKTIVQWSVIQKNILKVVQDTETF